MERFEGYDAFNAKLKESTKIRTELNDVLHMKMSSLAKIFNTFFEDHAGSFKYLKDMMYYQGGYPNETSPPRVDVVLDRFAVVYKYFKFLGTQNILDNYLHQYGITITVEDMQNEDVKFDAKTADLFELVFHDLALPKTKKELLRTLLDEGMVLQKDICEKADIIKINHASEIKDICKIEKADYVKAVNLNYKRNKEKPIEKSLEAMDNKITSMEKAYSVFENKDE
jgi:hypothetical protein